MSEYPSRSPFFFDCVMLITMRVLAFWIPGTAALVLGIFVARIVFYKWLDNSEVWTAWLLKTVVIMGVGAAVVLGLEGIQSWYTSGN